MIMESISNFKKTLGDIMTENFYIRLGTRLRELRKSKGFTTEDVARELGGVSRTYITKIETAASQPNGFAHLAAFAKLYGASADYILGLSDNPQTEGDSGISLLVQMYEEMSPEAQQRILEHMRITHLLDVASSDLALLGFIHEYHRLGIGLDELREIIAESSRGEE